jgi:hypothetical protein
MIFGSKFKSSTTKNEGKMKYYCPSGLYRID